MKPGRTGRGSGCSCQAATTNDNVTIPSRPIPFSMTLNVPNHSTSHAASPSGTIHHWNPMLVSSLIAIAAPPSSAASKSVSIRISAPSGTS